MFLWDAWHFPNGETHLPNRMKKIDLRVDGRLTYQYPLYLEALGRTTGRGVAVDVGAHIGLFSYWMVRDFDQVIAFEPVEAHRECWRANVPERVQDLLYPFALGATDGSVRLEPVDPSSSGGTYVAGTGPIDMYPLDRFNLQRLDLLKIDCEGYERNVLEGAVRTVKRCRPVVVVEQRPKQVALHGNGATDAVKGLQRLGASVAWSDQRDFVMVWS